MGLQEIFNKLHNTNLAKEEFEKTNLTIHKVELGLIDEVEKKLDKANSERRKLQTEAIKIADAFNDLQAPYNIAFKQAKDAENMAKELGVKVSDIKGIATLEEINKDLSREINLLKYPAIR